MRSNETRGALPKLGLSLTNRKLEGVRRKKGKLNAPLSSVFPNKAAVKSSPVPMMKGSSRGSAKKYSC